MIEKEKDSIGQNRSINLLFDRPADRNHAYQSEHIVRDISSPHLSPLFYRLPTIIAKSNRR